MWGWDLAKSTDFTVGIALDEDKNVCRLERFQHDWSLTVEIISEYVRGETCVVDSTGVGDPILELLREKVGWTVEGFKFSSTSKQQLIEGLAVTIQQGEVGFPEGVITSELMAFGYEQTRTGVRYEAKTGHDDAVIALALSLHAHKNQPSQGVW